MTDGLRIAVLGAGYIGAAFARAAAADRRHTVYAVRRTAVESADGVTWLRGDVASGAIENLPTRLDGIVLTVAPSRGSDAYDATYPPCATAAVALARESGATRLVYTSSTGVYGGRDGAWVSETTTRLGVGGTNAALIAAEDIILDAGIPASTVLRVAGIYGPGRDPRARMMNAAALPQRGEYWTNLAHRDDIVAALLHVLSLTHPPRVLNVSDGSPRRAADVAAWLCADAGRDPASLVFGNDAGRSRNDQRVSNAALVATGWAPTYPSFRDGFTLGL
ncbi:MAG: NAD(P)H-binding protein [Gemmatimonadaceae bacterium]|nr:NAD(P)H-binding protein [Gemmatimonadaceae bacterium]